MAVNKVIYGGNTLVDLTGDTVTASDLAEGVKATGADGKPIVGLMKKVTIDSLLSNTSTNPVQNKVIKAELDKKMAKTDKIYEANLEWGGRSIANGYSPIDAAMISELGANRFAFGNAAGITIEYSTDAGNTWLDYGSSDIAKTALFTTGSTHIIGKSKKGTVTTDCLLRVTIDTDAFRIYTVLNKFAIFMSTGFCTGCYCVVEASLENTPTKFVKFVNKESLRGNSGWNIINIANLITYGNSPTSQYGLIRFTFGCTDVGDASAPMSITKIMGFGGVGWHTPSNMAKTGLLYTYNTLQEAIFPATVTAPNFIGKFNGKTIEASVPANAKFTDTVYTHPATHPASMITGLSTVATSGSYNDLSNKPIVVKSVNNVTPDENGNVDITIGGGGGSTDTANTWTVAQKFGDVVFDGVGKYKNEKITQVSGQEVRPTTQYAVIMPDGSSTLAINLQELLAQTSPDYTDVLHFRFIITTQSRSITLRVFSDHGTVFAPENTSLGGSISILEGCALSGASGIAFITVTNMELIGNEAIA